MTETKADAFETQKRPYFRANLRLWSDTEPLAPLVHGPGQDWTEIDVKGEIIPATGRVAARIASRHYASSKDTKYSNVQDIAPILSHWLDEIERGAPPISAFAKAGDVEAVLWVAIFGHDPVAAPDLPEKLVKQARRLGVKILIENYTIMDENTGNPAKTWIAVND